MRVHWASWRYSNIDLCIMRGSSGSSDRPSTILRFYYRVMSICKPRCAIDVCTQHTKHYVWSSFLKWGNTMERKCSAKNLNERLPKCSFSVLIVFSKFCTKSPWPCWSHHSLMIFNSVSCDSGSLLVATGLLLWCWSPLTNTMSITLGIGC